MIHSGSVSVSESGSTLESMAIPIPIPTPMGTAGYFRVRTMKSQIPAPRSQVLDPRSVLGLLDVPELAPVGLEVTERLQRAVAHAAGG